MYITLRKNVSSSNCYCLLFRSKISLSISASNAASERNWSNFSFIQNIKRNRLTNERTFKLVSIYSNLRLVNGQKLNDDNINEEELENLDEIIVIEESEESNIEH